MSEVTIRQMQPSDLLAVCELEKENFSMPWSEKAFLDSMERQDTVFLTAVAAGEIVGYLGCYCIAGTGEITNVAVKSTHRRQGIGAALLETVFEAARTASCEEIILEVRESNEAAIELYTRQGFERLSVRKNFYEKPVENAVIMRKML